MKLTFTRSAESHAGVSHDAPRHGNLFDLQGQPLPLYIGVGTGSRKLARALVVLLALLALAGAAAPAWAQCTTGCTETVTTNVAPTTNPVTGTLCITTGSALTYNTNFNVTGGTVCIGPNVTFSQAGGTYTGNWTINNSAGGTFTKAITLAAGQTFTNNGTSSAAITVNGGTYINNGTQTGKVTLTTGTFTNSGTYSAALQLDGGTFTNTASLTVNTSFTIAAAASFSNSGTAVINTGFTTNGGAFTSTGPFSASGAVTLNGSPSFSGATSFASTLTNNGTLSFTGTLTVSGNYAQGTGGSVVGLNSAQCNILNVTGTIQNQGTYNGTNGLVLNKALNGSCSCLTNGTLAPGTQFSAPTLAMSGTDVTGTVTLPGGSPAPTHYLILRRAGSAVTDVPTAFGSYTVGGTLGSSKIVAINPVGTLSFTDANVLAAGCNTYNYAIYAYTASGSCGVYNAALSASNQAAATYASVGGTVAGGTTVCAGATSGTLSLSGQTGSVVRWESSTDGFATSTPIANTGTSYTSGALSQTTQFRAVVNAGTGCSNANSAATTVTVTTAPAVPAIFNGTVCGTGSTLLIASPGAGETVDWYAASTGGSPMAGGTGTTTFTTPTISASTMYYAQARNTTCGSVSPTRAVVWASVVPSPSVTVGGGGTYCAGSSATFTSTGSNITNQYWTGPSFFASTANITLNPVTAGMAGTYTLTASNLTGNSIAANGDFEAGNTGFTSSYGYSNNLNPEGLYSIQNSPRNVHSAFATCSDHTPGAGTLMMVVNGATVAGVNIWGQSVAVEPYTYYQFSYWETSVTTGNPSQLQLYINGAAAGPTYAVDGTTTCTWQQFFYNWYSGSATTASLSLVNQQTSAGGNDFALDDIVFQKACQDVKTVTLTVAYPTAPVGTGGQRCATGTVNISAAIGTNETVDWYANASGGTALLSGSLTYTTPSISATTTYYAQTRNLSTGCVSATRTAVVATVNPLPTVSGSTPGARCGTGTVGLAAATATGGTIDWYAASTGGTALATGSTSFTTPSISASTTFYAEARNTTTGCVSAARTGVLATVNTPPAAPTTTGGSVCGSGTVGLSSTPGTGNTSDWYAAASGGTALATGTNTYTTPTLSTTTTYYVETRNTTTTCLSTTRTPVVATVNALPATPAAVNGARCNMGTVVIGATPGAGETIDWYAGASGGVALSSGSTTFTTPTISGTMTYYAQARNTTTGCVSASRAAVTATVNTPPGAVSTTGGAVCGSGTVALSASPGSGLTVDWYAAASGGTALATGTSTFTTPSISTTTNYYAETRDLATGCAATSRTTTVATVNPLPATATGSDVARCGPGSVTLAATAPGGSTIDWYTSATGGTAVATYNPSYNVTISATTTYYAESRNTTTGCVSAARKAIVATVNGFPAPPTSPVDGQRCGSGTVALSATPVSGATIDWYDYAGASSGPVLGTGNSYTGSITYSRYFYAESRDLTTGCVSTSRTGVYATMNAVPAMYGTTDGQRCGTGTVNIAGNPSTGDIVDWYTASTGGTLVGTGNTFTTPSITATTVYYGQARTAATGCVSASRQSVNAVVNPLPAAPVTTGNFSCTSVYMTVSSNPGSGNTTDWYSAPTGGSAFYTYNNTYGKTFTVTETYYTEARNTTTGCVSASRTSVTATIGVAAPAVTPAGRCGTGTVTLSATPGSGEVIDWFATSSSTPALATGNSYTTPSISTTTTYYAQARNTGNGCTSTRVAVTATVGTGATVPTGSGSTRCGTGTVTLTATPGSGETIDWYSAASGGTLLLSGNVSYTTPSISATTSYYAQSRNTTTGCTSTSRLTVTATIGTIPAAPTSPVNGTRCGTGTVALSATVTTGNTIDWYAAATGGAALATGSTTYSPTVSATTTFYAEARSTAGNCLSTTRMAVTATVNAQPGVATSPVDASRCGTGTLTLSATPPTGMVLDWYAASTGGTVLAGGSGTSSFTTPSISATTTYYAEARNASTGCVSASRVAATATVNAVPSLTLSAVSPVCSGVTSSSVTYSAVTGGADQYMIDWSAAANSAGMPDVAWTALSGGTIPLTSIPAAAGSYSANFSVRNTLTGCVNNTVGGGSSTVCGSMAEGGSLTLTAPTGGVFTAINFASYGTPTGSCGSYAISSCHAATSVSVMQAACVGQSTCTVAATNTTFGDPCSGTVKMLTVEAVTSALVLTVNALPASPTAGDAGRCGPGTVTISATPATGETIDWYAASTGGAALATASTSYTTPSISTTTSYYAASRNTTTGCVSAARTAVTATVNAVPTASISPSATTVCSGLPSTLTASGGGTYLWSTGATTAAITVSPTATTTYSVTVTGAGGCTATASQTVNVNDLPSLTLGATTPVCSGVTSSAIPYSAPTNGADQYSIDWDATANSAGLADVSWTALSGGNIPLTSLISTAGTYGGAILIRNSVTGCQSTIGNAAPVCGTAAENTSLTLTAPAGTTFSAITFASYGTPNGTCGAFTTSACHAVNSISIVSGYCVGQTTCTVPATNTVFTDPCSGTLKRLYVQAATTGFTLTINALPTVSGSTPAARCGTGTVGLAATTAAGSTIDWYAASTGGTALSTGSTTYTTPSISTTTNYYAEARNTTTGCVSAARTSVTATVNSAAAAPTSVTNGARCGTGTVALSATPATGTVLDWYAASTGGAALATGTSSYTTPSLSATTTYYVEARNTTTGCLATSRTAVTATVNTFPAAPTGTPGATCGTGTVLIGATPGTGETIDWYAASTGGTVLTGGTGTTSFTTPSISASTTYYAQARNSTSGCVSATRTSVLATVNALPTVTGSTPATRCGTGTVSLAATTAGGNTIDWYAASTGGTALATASTSFTTPSISTTTTYYAEARNTTTGCVSTARTAVVATVNATPAAPVATDAARCGNGVVTLVSTPGAGNTTDWYNTSSGGAAFLNGTDTFSPSVSATTTLYIVSRNTITGCISATRTPITATVNSIPGGPTAGNGTRCGTGTVLIGATPATGETIDWYAASTGGTVLAGGSGTTSFTTPSISATTTYYAEARNSTSGCVSTGRTAVTATVNAQSAAPATAGGSVCGSGTVTLTSTPGAGNTSDWYAASTGGTALATGTNSYAPSVSSTTSFYVETRNTTTGCLSATRAIVTATVNPLPAAPAGTPGSVCGSGTVALSATPGAGETIDWYAASTGGTALATGTTGYTTPSISVSTTYYAQARNTTTGCLAATRTAVLATVNALPTVTGTTPGARCGTGTVSLAATTATGSTLDWYAASTGGTVLAGGSSTASFTTPSISATTTYYVEARNTATGCVSAARTSVAATVNAVPTAGISASATAICPGGSSNLTASGGGTYLWSTGATTAAITVSPAATTTYSVTVTGTGGCTATASQTVTVNPSQNITMSAPSPICAGQTSVALPYSSVTGGADQYMIDWNAAANSAGLADVAWTNIPPSAITLTGLPPTAGTYTGTLYLRNTTTGCQTNVGTSYLVINPLPTVASASSVSRCGSGSVMLTATASSGATLDWYAASTGGTALATGTTSYNTPTLTATTTYYVQARNTTTGCVSSARTAVTATITTMPTAAISYSGSPFCQSVGGTRSATLTGTGGGTYSSTAGLSINTTSGDVNVAASTAGTYTVTYTIPAAGGCPAVTATASITLTPDVTVGAVSGPATLCQNAGSIAYSATLANATSSAWAVTGTGNTVSGSGTVTWAPAFSGTATVTVTAQGCAGPVSKSATVTVRASGYWLGIGSDWNTAANWCGGVPTSTTDVVIPTGTAVMPQVSASATARSLWLQTGTSLTLNASGGIDLYGAFTKDGTFTQGTGSWVQYASAGAQTVLPIDYVNLVTSGTGVKTFSSTGTTRISGSFTPGAGTHVVTGSTLEFNGTGAQSIPAFSFNNLSTSGNSAKSLTGDVSVGGALALADGTLDIAASTLSLNGTIDNAGTGTLSGNCSSILQLGGNASAMGTLHFTPTANTLAHLRLLKTAPGVANLGDDLFICTYLTLNQGKVILGASNLTLLPGAMTDSGKPGSYVVTKDQQSPTGAGFFVQQMPTNGGSRTFPVGSPASFTPAYLANAGSTRNFAVRVFNDIFEHGITGGLITNLEASVKRSWQIEPLAGAGTPNVSVKLQWNPGDEGTYFTQARANYNLPYIGKNSNTATSTWVAQLTGSRSMATSPFRIMTPSISNFSTFTIGSEMTPLPVRMGDLKAEAGPLATRLSWETYGEQDAKGFTVLRSANGRDFAEVGYVAAAGNSNAKRTYGFSDATQPGRVYYKLRFNGINAADVAYSNVVTVAGSAPASFKAWPVPAQTALHIEGDELATGAITSLRLIDIQGRAILLPMPAPGAGTATVDVAGLKAGVYMLEGLSGGTVLRKQRIVKL